MNKWSIIFIGNLMVNIPVTLIILGGIYVISVYFNIVWNISLIIAVVLGWYIWSKLIDVWVNHCLKKGASKDEIFSAGKMGLINFNRNKVFDVEDK